MLSGVDVPPVTRAVGMYNMVAVYCGGFKRAHAANQMQRNSAFCSSLPAGTARAVKQQSCLVAGGLLISSLLSHGHTP
jgi:hypothetical protein